MLGWSCRTDGIDGADAVESWNAAVRTEELKVQVAGSGAGTVDWTFWGVPRTCSSTCYSAVPRGEVVTLNPTPTGTASFAGWVGDCTGTGVCSVTLNRARSVTAVFTASTNPAVIVATAGMGTVTSSPTGINCGTAGSSCAAEFTSGATVTLSAAPDVGQTFKGWSGACSGTGACVVTASGAKSVTALFSGTTFPIHVTLTGTGAGTVASTPGGIYCGGAPPDGGTSTCGATFSPGSVVSLAAAPSGTSVATWFGDCFGTPAASPCSLTVDGPKSVLVELARPGTAFGLLSAAKSTMVANPAELRRSATTSITITARDYGGALLAGKTLALSASPAGSCTLSTPAPTNAVGVTTATLKCANAGTRTLTATADGQSLITTVTFTNACGTPVCTPGAAWSTVSSGLTSTIRGVWGSAANDVWAVDDLGWSVSHWDGSAWSHPTTCGGCSSSLYGVWGTASNDVWALGQAGTILHWDGAAWSRSTSGTTQNMLSAWGNAANDVWAVGWGGTIRRWNGSAWSVVASGVTTNLTRVWGTGPNDVWAVGFGGTILHWNGSGWSASTSGTTNNLFAIWGAAANDVWAAGQGGTILHWDGAAWSADASGVSAILSAVWGTSSTDVWAAGQGGALLHWNGCAWCIVAPSGTTSQLRGVWGSSAVDIWAVGDSGTILHGP